VLKISNSFFKKEIPRTGPSAEFFLKQEIIKTYFFSQFATLQKYILPFTFTLPEGLKCK
jgi:hypothetical protein